MASKMRIEFKSEGFSQIAQSGEVMALVEQAANDIAARADANLAGSSYAAKAAQHDSGHHVSTHIGHAYGATRAIGNVSTSGYLASLAEADEKTLTSAVM